MSWKFGIENENYDEVLKMYFLKEATLMPIFILISGTWKHIVVVIFHLQSRKTCQAVTNFSVLWAVDILFLRLEQQLYLPGQNNLKSYRTHGI